MPPTCEKEIRPERLVLRKAPFLLGWSLACLAGQVLGAGWEVALVQYIGTQNLLAIEPVRGLILGTLQFLVVRKLAGSMGAWIPLTAFGLLASAVAGQVAMEICMGFSDRGDFGVIPVPELAIALAHGAVLGLAQWPALVRLSPRAWSWIAGNIAVSLAGAVLFFAVRASLGPSLFGDRQSFHGLLVYRLAAGAVAAVPAAAILGPILVLLPRRAGPDPDDPR